MKEKTDKVNLGMHWPCYACAWNNREEYEEPCASCKNVGNVHTKDNFEPIVDPR